VAAIALGRIFLRGLGAHRSFGPWEGTALSFGLGATGLGVITLLFGRFGLLGTWQVRTGLAFVVLVEILLLILELLRRDDRRSVAPIEGDGHEPSDAGQRSSLSRLAQWGLMLVVGPFVLVMALGAMLPTIDYDALSYHLQVPKEYYQQGRI